MPPPGNHSDHDRRRGRRRWVIGTLTDYCAVSEADAHVVDAEGIRRGGTLVTVRTTDDRIATAESTPAAITSQSMLPLDAITMPSPAGRVYRPRKLQPTAPTEHQTRAKQLVRQLARQQKGSHQEAPLILPPTPCRACAAVRVRHTSGLVSPPLAELPAISSVRRRRWRNQRWPRRKNWKRSSGKHSSPI